MKRMIWSHAIGVGKRNSQRLRAAVEVGDMAALLELASELKARNDAASICGEKIARFAEEFDFDGLLKLASNLDVGDS